MKIKDNKGFTFVEVLVGTTLFLIIALSVYALFNLSIKWVGGVKARVEAMAIANEKTEMIRNMPYDGIKTTSGWSPPGVIPSSQTISKSGIEFITDITVAYVNDSFDGTSAGSVPPDLYPWDYKKVEVKVSWQSFFGGQNPVLFNTIVAPKGLEGASSGKGGIWIKVFDASGNGVNAASVHVENTNLNPDYIIDTFTDAGGNVFLTDLDPDNQEYQIIITKAGYSSERNYSVSELNALGYLNATPERYPATVIVGQVTEESFAVDLLSNLTINTVNENTSDELQTSNDVTNAHQGIPHLAADSFDNIFFVWYDERSGNRNYGQKYDVNQVKKWVNDVLLSNQNNQTNPQTAVASDGNLYVSWNDSSIGNQEIYLDKYSSVDGADILGGSKRIDTGSTSDDQIKPSIAVDNLGNVAVSWVDYRNGDTDIYLRKLDNVGEPVWASELRANSDAGVNNQSDSIVAIDQSGNDIYTIWSDNRNGSWDVYMAKFDTNGTRIWGSDVKINTNVDGSNQSIPSAVIDSAGNIYIAWSDERNGVSDVDVYMQKYDSNGIKSSTGVWASGDLKVNSDLTQTKQDDPSVSIDVNDNLFVTWTDERNISTASDIYLQKLDSDGNKMWPSDVRINSDLGQDAQNNPAIVTLSDGRVVIAWQDERNGDFDIYSAIYSEPNSQARADVPLRIYLNKEIGKDQALNPIYKYLNNDTTDANGVLILNNIEWGSYNVQVTGGGFTLVATDPLQPVSIDPNSSATIKVNVEP